MCPVSDQDGFLKYAALLDKTIDDRGAQTVFYGTWSRKSALADQPKFDDACRVAARAGDAYLAPVGAAWARVRKERPDLDLFAADGSYPSYAGTYLGACVFYGVILRSSPEGAPALKMPPADAAYLQKTAAQTRGQFMY